MEIVTAIVTPVVESLMVPIKKHLGYLISCTRYLRKMDTRKRELDAKRVSVQNHMDHNRSNNFQVPAEVSVWLQEVEEIEAKVKQIPDDVGSCFNLKVRHRFGRKAFKITEEINGLIERSSSIDWTDHPIPLAKVGSMKASTSTTSTLDDEFKSREETLMKALKALQPDHKSHMLALCGMGGVGKTTMMQKIKTIVSEKKMFDYIVEAAIGEKTDPIAIQQAVAEFLGTDLKETTKEARAAKLRKSFGAKSDGGKKKILLILDDVWQFVDINDIGLSSLPNQGVDFKVLLTSRNREVCIQMGVEVDSIIAVEVLTDLEAQSFLYQFARSSGDANFDPYLLKIGEKIAIRCQGLPIAIKTIASALKGKNKHVWENALSRLEHHDDVVHQIFEMSYNNLHDEETRSTLLLCVLFPEDFDVPTEDLVRYGWGLKLFDKVDTIREARNKLNAYIEQLIDANLLIQSQVVGCIKMHDLVRAFVLDICSKGEYSSIVGDMSTWSTEIKSESCKRISLSCQGMREFPRGFKCPNLSLLKLMHKDESLEFPAGFYGNTEKLQVIVYERIMYPSLPRSLECSINLRTLCLHRCSLMFDLFFIGNLSNLEVLTFVECGIRKLPSSIGNLKRLKLLDVTGCVNLRIDDGVLKNLVALEELYMRVSYKTGVKFTNANKDELVECAKNLLALEIEFFDDNVFPNNISFEKLERFKISLGCYIEESRFQEKCSFGNTLKLVTNKSELLESGVNVLFDKTEELRLEVDDIYHLGDGLAEFLHHHKSLFYNLRLLHICKCSNMKYLFTVHVAHGLPKLERLTISQCPVLESLIHGENNGVEEIRFQVLKILSLVELPKLTSLCNIINVVELPQLEELILDGLPHFRSIYPNNELATSSNSNDTSAMQSILNNRVVISELKILRIRNMKKLKEIWPSKSGNNKDVGFLKLREIKVEGCDDLVNLFPINPMLLLHYLERIDVRNCGSINVLFNIDLRCIHEVEGGSWNFRTIVVDGLGKLSEVWRVKGVYNSNLPILGFQAIEYIEIRECMSLRNVFTPTTIDFDLPALKEITIDGIVGWGKNKSDNEMVKSGQCEEIDVISNKDVLETEDSIPSVAFPSYLIHTFNHLHTLKLSFYEGVEVVFDLEGSSCRNLASTRSSQQPRLLPYIKDLEISYMERMTDVWKYNRNTILMSRTESNSSFHNLTNITLTHCCRIKYLFSPIMAKLLSNLKIVEIWGCDAMEEVVSNRDDEDEQMTTSISSNTNTTFFPHLDHLRLYNLKRLKFIDGVDAKCGEDRLTFNNTSARDKVQCNQVDVAYWSLCQYSKKIYINGCNALSNVIPSHLVGQQLKLEEMDVYYCKSMRQIFEVKGVNNDVGQNTSVGDGSYDTSSAVTILRCTNMTSFELPNLKILRIGGCCLLEYIFTSSMLESLKRLEELVIWDCMAVQVIVKEHNEGQSIASKDVVFPRLKSLLLCDLPCLKAFFLGNNDFQWPLLDKVEIYYCPQMMTFTSGNSSAPKLNYIHTGLGKHSLECGLNFDWTNVAQKRNSSAPDIVKLLQFPWSFSNLIEVDQALVSLDLKTFFPCNELLKLQNHETSNAIQTIEEATNEDVMETQSDVMCLKQKEVTTNDPYQSKCIWESSWWAASNLSNLTKVSINDCGQLEHMFCYCMVGSLMQLQSLHINSCYKMEVIVKQVQDSETKVNEVVFPRLKSLKLRDLESLKAFYLGREAFQWPSLDTLEIEECPKITVFTNGQSTTQKLKVIKTGVGLFEITEDINSFIRTQIQEGYEL